MTELTAIGRGEWPAITQVVFRNYQWGAEKRNSTLWYEDNFVGTELDQQVSYAGIAKACGLQGVVARTMEELTDALRQAIVDQKAGKTTLMLGLLAALRARGVETAVRRSRGLDIAAACGQLRTERLGRRLPVATHEDGEVEVA